MVNHSTNGPDTVLRQDGSKECGSNDSNILSQQGKKSIIR
jgi:hypothetical protein